MGAAGGAAACRLLSMHNIGSAAFGRIVLFTAEAELHLLFPMHVLTVGFVGTQRHGGVGGN